MFMKKTLSLFICAVLLVMLWLPASAAHVSGPEAIETLETLGLVKGTGNGFEPERGATRAEALVMLLRLLGQEDMAWFAGQASPFDDGGWADRYLGYAYVQGLVRGVSDTHFGSDDPVSARDYATMMLRALGYRERTDFTWGDSLRFSDHIGLTHGEYTGESGEAFLREDMALVSYTALTLKLKGSERKLIESLYASGSVSADALKQTRFADTVNLGRNVYSAAEIHEMSSSAVLFVETYPTEEDLLKQSANGTASGFLVTGDGVAVMSYHELEGASRARATTPDGKSFDITGVLFYDTLRDVAVVRLSRTSTDGETVRFFPYLDIGDSDALGTGEPVYTVSSPLGLIDSVSSGLISNRNRVVDDPLYPCIQITAPIASGSSGGPLLDRYGDVIGVLFASYTRGENMNLAVPINCIRDVDLTGQGIALDEVLRLEDEKKAAAVITAEKTEFHLKAGETERVLISTDCPGMAAFQFRIREAGVVQCAWSDFAAKQSVWLSLTGIGAGSAEVQITFSDGSGNEDALLSLSVTVTEDPPAGEASEEDVPEADAAPEMSS